MCQGWARGGSAAHKLSVTLRRNPTWKMGPKVYVAAQVGCTLMIFSFTTVRCRMVRWLVLPALLCLLTSRFDMNEYGVVYAELTDSQLDE